MTRKRQKHTSQLLHTTPSNASDSQGHIFDRKLARRDAKQLGLHKADLPNSIKEVIATLNEAGFEAYIVGGGVRDALLGLKPKDFDAVTNATPNQVKEVFGKRCRIIGRRFLLCHVYSGRDMIEVATFRAPPKDNNHLTEDGMIMRDNVWGDIFQDVVRRDFSINAMYYQPLEGFVYDFCGGFADIQSKTIRLLGDTQKRIEEDPVRLLRALRFKAKLGFEFDDALEQQFNEKNWALLSQVSPHRLYDETQKMFTGGYLTPLLPLLFDYKAFEALVFYPPTMITPLIDQVTANTDKRIGQGKSINPAFFYAALLWENYLFLLDKFKKNSPFSDAQIQAANKVMDKQRPHTAMPKFAEQFIKDIWLMQPRLAEPRRKNLQKLFENPRFRAGFDFLMLREQVEAKTRALSAELGQAVTLDSESTNGMGHWWAWFQTLNAKQQQKAIDEFDLQAVRLRFANFVHNDASITPSRDDMAANHQSTNRRERRAEKRFTERGQKSHLTEQEQQEKDQLQLLSLANDTPSNNEPAQPLWGTPFNHQVADTEVIAPRFATNLANDFDKDNDVSSPKNNRRKTSNAKRTHDRSDSSERRPKSDRQTKAFGQVANAVPAIRKRRVPSSDLSVIERRHIEEDTVNLTAQEEKVTESLLVSVQVDSENANKPIPKKRTRKAKISESVEPVAKVKTVENEKPIATAETSKPKRTPRIRKKAVEQVTEKLADDVKVLANDESKTKKPPAKRTRKKVIKTDVKAEGDEK